MKYGKLIVYKIVRFNFCYILLGCLINFLLVACENGGGSNNKALVDKKGNQRKELSKVIDNYSLNPKDSLKLRAAQFLIENMEHHFEIRSNDTIPDIELMTSGLLIENIEYAFKAWEFPWAKHLSFNDFCEYILPYRFGTEELESWRPEFMKEFSWLADSMGNNDDPLRACELISANIVRWFTYSDLRGEIENRSARTLLNERKGYCIDEAAIVCFAMRSMGVPVTHELVPSWGFMNKGHDFNAVLNKTGRFVPFTGMVFRMNDPYKIERVAKVYRKKFSKSLVNLRDENELGVDVTSEYVPVKDVEIPLTKELRDKLQSTFLCVFNFGKWVPVAKGDIEKSKLHFKNLGVDILYTALGEIDGEFRTVQAPFLVDRNGLVKYLKPQWPDVAKTKIIKKKLLNDSYDIVGGEIQASNDPEFKEFSLVHTINSPLNGGYNVITPLLNKSYRFWRLILPNGLSTIAEISEIDFVSLSGNRGTLVGDLKKGKGYISDKDTLTYSLIGGENGNWTGVDFKQKEWVGEILIYPRNYYFYKPEEECEYELFYYINSGWQSLGTRKGGVNYFLKFEETPTEALFYLKNLTEGTKSRPFTFDNDIIKFW